MNSIKLHDLELYLVYVDHIFPQYFMANFLERSQLVGLKLSISSFPKSGYDNYIWHKKTIYPIGVSPCIPVVFDKIAP